MLTYAWNCDEVFERPSVCVSNQQLLVSIQGNFFYPLPFVAGASIDNVYPPDCFAFAECQRNTNEHVGVSSLGRVGCSRSLHRRWPNAGCRSGVICIAGLAPGIVARAPRVYKTAAPVVDVELKALPLQCGRTGLRVARNAIFLTSSRHITVYLSTVGHLDPTLLL